MGIALALLGLGVLVAVLVSSGWFSSDEMRAQLHPTKLTPGSEFTLTLRLHRHRPIAGIAPAHSPQFKDETGRNLFLTIRDVVRLAEIGPGILDQDGEMPSSQELEARGRMPLKQQGEQLLAVLSSTSGVMDMESLNVLVQYANQAREGRPALLLEPLECAVAFGMSMARNLTIERRFEVLLGTPAGQYRFMVGTDYFCGLSQVLEPTQFTVMIHK